MARTHDEALRAAKLVEIEYEELPALISIQDAIQVSAVHGSYRSIRYFDFLF